MIKEHGQYKESITHNKIEKTYKSEHRKGNSKHSNEIGCDKKAADLVKPVST